MAITGLIRAARSLPGGRGGIVAASSALAALLAAGCGGGGGGQGLAAKASAQGQRTQAPVRTMQVEKHYKDAEGNRFALEISIGPVEGDGGVCAELSASGSYSHGMVITVRSETVRSRKVRLPRIAVENRAVTFTTTDKTGVACSTIVSNSDKTVLRGGQHKDFQGLVSRPRDPAGDLVLTIWPPGKPQEELLRIPFASLP